MGGALFDIAEFEELDENLAGRVPAPSPTQAPRPRPVSVPTPPLATGPVPIRDQDPDQGARDTSTPPGTILRIAELSVELVESNSTFSASCNAIVVGHGGEVVLELHSGLNSPVSSRRMAEILSLTTALEAIDAEFPGADSGTIVLANLSTSFGGYVIGSLPGYHRQGFLEDGSVLPDITHPVAEAFRPAYRALAEVLLRKPVIVNWTPESRDKYLN